MGAHLLLPIFLLLAGCSSSTPAPLAIYAATSLTDAFTELAELFQVQHPNRPVQLHWAGSQVLRLQIEQGAPADVYASANVAHMRTLQARGHVGPESVFAHNTLVVIVPRDRDPSLTTFADLPRAQRIVMGTEDAPVGRYARQVMHKAEERLGADFARRVRSQVVSHESNTRQVRAKVALGEADAALVYASDAHGFPAVRTIAIPSPLNVSATYQMGIITGTERAESARAWVDFVTSAPGRTVLSKHGFVLP